MSIKSADNLDGMFEYVKTVVWRGLSDMIRRDAVRKNNGPMMTLYWKVDLLEFARYNHTKYLILAHRLIASLNGFLPERLRQDLIWNRTVNLRGGRGNNDEADLVNEFLNREFKDSSRSAGSHSTTSTIERHGKLTGGLGNVIDDIYGQLTDVRKHPGKDKTMNRTEDLTFFVDYLRGENLTTEKRGRAFKRFPQSRNNINLDIKKLCKKIEMFSKKLDRARRVAH